MKLSGSSAKKNRHSKAWMALHMNDPYVKLAQQEGYRARAAYKLKQIDEEFRLLKANARVVDLGAAPGSWCQYVVRQLTQLQGRAPRSGQVVALDLLPIEAIEHVTFLQGDFREEAFLRELEKVLVHETKAENPLENAVHGIFSANFEKNLTNESTAPLSTANSIKLDLVISDMAPNLSGVASADAARMADLCGLAIDFALRYLRAEGALVMKCFQGSGFSQVVQQAKKTFVQVKIFKPAASRSQSSETFVVCRRPKTVQT